MISAPTNRIDGTDMKQRIKMDYNKLIEQIDEVISKSGSKVVRENAFGISVGLSLLSSYLAGIANRAIELNDAELLELLLDMHVLKKEE